MKVADNISVYKNNIVLFIYLAFSGDFKLRVNVVRTSLNRRKNVYINNKHIGGKRDMLKRITKITSLLVCAASVISIMPVMAADVKSYDAQEGDIYYAKAKGSGIYIDGEINGNDEDVYFMTPDGKYNSLDGVDTGVGLDDILLGQYMVLDDGDTVLDIKDNYKEIDENTRADLQDDVAATAKKVLKHDNDGRFDSNEFTSIKPSVGFAIGGTGLSPYTYKLKDPFITTQEGTVKDSDTVYVDYAGNYVDVDYNLGNLKVTTTGGSITMKNTDDTYELTETVNGVKTTYEYKAVISQKSNQTDIGDYVYRWANLSIYKKVKDAADNTYINVTDQVGFGSNGYNDFVDSGSNFIEVFEKFSKPSDSDDTIDGIKYAKESTIYFMSDEDGKSEVILGKSASASASEVGSTYDSKDLLKITGNDKGFCTGYLSYNEKKVYAQSLNLKSKQGFNYIDLGDIESTDTDITDTFYSTGGNILVLDGGYIKTWGSDEKFTKLYKVDGGMDHMSIGNKDFIILWNEDDEIYTIINNTATTTTTTGETTATGTTTAAAGWVKAADGTWSYNKADGTKATGWLKDGSTWYYLKSDGDMATGWVQDGSTWYYLNTSGAMQTGWINDNGTWYYCNASGAMLLNTTVDGYLLGANGAWIH